MQQKLNININIKNNTKLSNLFIFDLHNSVLKANDFLIMLKYSKIV